MKIRFLKDYQVQAENGESYKAGEVYDLPDLSAKHFLRKGRAEIVESVTTPEFLPPEAAKAVKQTESRKIGARGGDSAAKFGKAQKSYRKKALEGEK